MAVREGAPLGVLAGEADRRPVGEERAEGERLGLRPVDAALLAEHVPPALERLRELRVDYEAVGHGEELLVQRAQLLLGDGRLDLRVRAPADAALPAPRTRAERRLQLLVDLPQVGVLLLQEPLGLLGSDDSELGEPAAYCSRAVGCSSISLYMSGCV